MKYIERAAYVLVLLAVALHLAFPLAAPYVLSVGAAGVAVARLRERYEGTNIRLRRNLRTRHLVGILFVVAAYAMFRPGRYWLPLLLVAALLDVYTLWVVRREEGRN